uniref:receptor protein-tyrosine kinase n=1 Tax=Mesocestoides corti TaxID=53468 RepID=A0A5K3EKH8_MESCO
MECLLVILWMLLPISATLVTNVGEYKVCVSQMNEISGFPIEGTYEYLKRLINFNCTHIVGNLVIFGLHQNLNGSDPDLSFLRSIQEISGFLIIMNSSVQEIPLSGLKIIRGLGGGYNIEKDLPFASIVIRHTYSKTRFLKRIDLSGLRVIQNGDVYMFDNPHGNDIISNISWSSLFANPAKQRFRNSSSVDLTLSDVPHVEMATQGRCRKRSCEWCFSQSGGEERCCDAECLGGCTGPSPSDCLVCKNYRDGDTCVHRCPPPLSLQNYRLALNVNFKYEFAGFCVEECPKSLMAEGPRCVWECSPGQYTAAGNVCVPCEKNCPKVCSLGNTQFSDASSLDATALASLHNCTKLSGNLIISDESYSPKGAHWKPITTTKELWALHSLREVTGYVHLNLRKHPAPLNNLTFLENLEKIGGSHARYSMSVVHNAIRFPGLYSLMEAPQGDVAFMESPELCYVQTIVTAKTADRNSFLPRFKILGYQLPTAEQCRARNAVCHPACDPAYGCWGPRREDCIRCRNRSIDGSVCVESCYDLPGYYDAPEESVLAPPPIQSRNDNPMTARLVLARLAADHAIEEATHTRFAEALERKKANITCSRCHSECAETCTGPGADQCVGECKNSKSSDECVSECQHTSYLEKESRICTPCQTHCHQRLVSKKPVCTGPGHHPGPGGCNKCEQFLEFITFDGVSLGESSRTQHGALLCMRGACPEGTFSTFEAVEPSSKFAPFVEEGVNAVPVCRSCHHLCSSCTGYSVIRANVKSPGCLECKGFWFNDTCVTECPEDSTFQISLTHPPETRKAYHFMQSIDQQGLLLSKKLLSPVKGAGEFPRPKIWSRHLDGRCLVCHEECRGGCWGPSNSHCHRCAHFRVWNRDEQAEAEKLARDMWQVSEGGNVYQLNKDISNRPLSQTLDYPTHFSCELACPPGLPYASVDPLTGDRTCHLSPELNFFYTDRENASSSRLGASLVGPIAVALVMFAVCVSIACYCKRRQSLQKFHFEGKTVISRVSGMFDGRSMILALVSVAETVTIVG